MNVFFFDESQKTDALQIKDGKLTFDNIDDLHSFIGVFCGYNLSDLPAFQDKVEFFESVQKSKLHLPLGREIKSTTFRKKNFEYGYASLNRNNKGFYNGLMKLIIEINPIIAISFTNKFEILLRKTITNIKTESKRVDNFYYTVSKFFSLYGQKDFFQTVIKYPEDALFNLSWRLKKSAERDAGIPRLLQRNHAFVDAARILDQVDFDVYPIDYTNYPFIVLPDALTLLLDELGIDPKDVDVVIDGQEGLYDCFEGRFHNVSYADSQYEPMIRISDHIAGLVSRMCYALRNDPHRREPNSGDSPEEKNRRRTLSPNWFEIKEDIFELYRATFDALILNNQHYWSTTTTSLHDDFSYFVTLLYYFHNFSSFEEYQKKNPEEHSNRFEDFSCNYTKGIPERPNNPENTLAKYE